MKKISKSIYILVPIIIVILISLIGMYNYRKPVTLHKVFNDAIVVKKSNKEMLKKTTIEINTKLHRGLYRGSILNFNVNFINRLDGEIIIDNKTYIFEGFTEKSDLNNIIGSAFEKNQSRLDGFMVKMIDLDTIILVGTGKNLYNVVAPSKTIEDYQHALDETTK